MERRCLKHSASAAMNEATTGTRRDTKDRTTVLAAGVGALALMGLVVASAALGTEWKWQEGNIVFAMGGTILGGTAIMFASLGIMGRATGGGLALGVVCLVTAVAALGTAAQKEVAERSSQARVIHAAVPHGTTTSIRIDGDWVTSLRSMDTQVEIGRRDGIEIDNTVHVFADRGGTIHAQAGGNAEQRTYEVEARTANGHTYQLVLDVGTGPVPTMIVVSAAARAVEPGECGLD